QVVAIVLEADGGGSSDPAVIDAVVALIDLHRADVEIEGHGPSAQILESERAALVARRDALDVRADAANATDESRPPARSREPDATESDPDEPRATLVPSERLPPARKDPREVLGPTLIAVGSAGTLAGVGLLLGGGLEARSDLAY